MILLSETLSHAHTSVSFRTSLILLEQLTLSKLFLETYQERVLKLRTRE